MHKQRMVIGITGLLGVVAVPMPWASALGLSINGLHESMDGFGIGIIVMGLIIIALSLLGNRLAGLSSGRFITVIVLDVLIIAVVLLIIVATQSQGGTFAENATIWFWMIPVMAFLGIVLAIVFKDKKSQTA